MKWFNEELEGFLIAERLRGRKVVKFGENCYGVGINGDLILGGMIEVFNKGVSFALDNRTETEEMVKELKSVYGEKIEIKWRVAGYDEVFKFDIHTTPDVVIELVKNIDTHDFAVKCNVQSQIYEQMTYQARHSLMQMKTTQKLFKVGKVV
jgi:hypothetical protein